MKRFFEGCVVLIVCLLARGASANEGGEYTAMTGTVSTALSATTPQTTVEQFSGAFSTGFKIDVPPGRRNIQPELKLSYNSRGGSSWVGLGWSLPLASITRSLKHGTPAYDTTDDFQFTGQELTLISGSTYRLKHESSFMTFTKDTTNNRWIATDLNGTKYYFGRVLSAEITGISFPTLFIVRPRAHDFAPLTVIINTTSGKGVKRLELKAFGG